MNYNQTALLVIDIQKALFEKKTPVFQETLLLENLQNIIDYSRNKKIKVIYLMHENDSFLKRDTEGWKLHPVIMPLEKEIIINKQHGSGFKNTPLNQYLKANNITTLIITGLVSHGCVSATAQDALKENYQLILIKDGHSTYTNDAKEKINQTNDNFIKLNASCIYTLELLKM